MSALAEALVAAQRRALQALEKAYVAGQLDAEHATEKLTECGITDPVDLAYLLACWDVLKEWGAAVPGEPRRLTLYVVGVCERCSFDLTGEDSERDEREARERLRGAESPREGTEA